MLASIDLASEIRAVQVAALVITGEPALDRVVPVEASRSYARLWPHARVATLARSGHLGLITRPREFAQLVVPFVEESGGAAAVRRRVG